MLTLDSSIPATQATICFASAMISDNAFSSWSPVFSSIALIISFDFDLSSKTDHSRLSISRSIFPSKSSVVIYAKGYL